MDCVFWLKQGLVAGRSGPDVDPWRIEELSGAGIGGVLSVNDARGVDSRELRAAGIEWLQVPLSDSAPPREGDAERCVKALPKALAFISASMGVGEPC